ncbi:two-component system response regulator RppA [Synechococcus sp. PCC 6312]|uniref:two-component system response regulator RppA n=1 Tax=Synechococcus sp. (strain ATCC 27167 / PCC 6312) TaxID=195253 RepID=UPI00029EFA6E|nr:two-component system response regulator RppA [Synechococcus sp. PCC 6312]AFY61818.1 response regulator with CheY-like receiver domain and winged-helix DNA-binding domain [Synechococcus sp. PCC 6312]
MRILFAEDEVELAEPLGRVLGQAGYEVELVHDGAAALKVLSQPTVNGYDLVILDWMLPQVSGLEICQHLRKMGNLTPVLFLTARDTLDDRVQGLDAGADDYLIKPFELRELLARVRALLRRQGGLANVSQITAIGGLELDSENRLAYRNGRVITLAEKEAHLLTYFLAHPHQVLTHDDIRNYLWPGNHPPSSNVLAAQIRLLRRKIERPGETALIHTVYGKGYRFGEQPEEPLPGLAQSNSTWD